MKDLNIYKTFLSKEFFLSPKKCDEFVKKNIFCESLKLIL